MDGFRPSIEVAPLQSEGSLYGFMLIGRWPHNTVEWAKFLVLAVQMAAVPGLLPASTVFRVREELPDQPQPGAVGLVVAEGQLMGPHPLGPGAFAAYSPPGLIVLHPPPARSLRSPTMTWPRAASSCPDCLTSVSTTVRPGSRSTWRARSPTWSARSASTPSCNADTAALAMLLAA